MVIRSLVFVLLLIAVSTSCGSRVETKATIASTPPVVEQTPTPQPTATPSPTPPNLQAEILDARNKQTSSPIGKFDFKNFEYALPRGWENPDGSDIKLVNGKLEPIGATVKGDMTDEQKAEAKANRRIGMSLVTVKYLDVNNDGEDEAVVVLKIETGGSAIPQVAYIYAWKNGAPELMWMFRTGDRADGGLKNLYRAEDTGLFVVELYGQDRFLLGGTETGKITGDYEQLCCPQFFTRTVYKWNGSAFMMQGKRSTIDSADPSVPPVDNMADIVNSKAKPGAKK